MKILYVVGDPTMRLSDNTGYARHMRECINALESLGSEVQVLTSGDEKSTVAQKKAFGKAKQLMPAWASNIIKDVARITYDARFAGRIEAAVRQFSPDIIYDRHALFHRSGVRTGNRLGVPTILEVNAIIAQEADRYFGLGLKSLAMAYERDTVRMASAIMVVNARLTDELVKLGVPREKVHVNPNGADPDRFNPSVDASAVRAKYGLEGYTVIGFLGSMVPWHGVPNVIEAAKIICPRYPQVKFLIVGDWTRDRSAIEKVHEYGIEDRVVFAGAVPLDDAPYFINAMDIATAPYADPTQVYGSSTKFYEYMAAGRAIVASNVAQMGDVIEDGVTGLLVVPGDSNDLAEKLMYLLDNPDLRCEMGRRAREVAVANHTWRQNAERILQVCQQLNKSKPNV